MSQLLITRQGQAVVSALHRDGLGIIQFHVTPEEADPIRVGDIYVGQITNIVKNLNAAFVELRPGRNGYLDLREKNRLIYVNPKKDKVPHQGDLILVQVGAEPVKSKPVSLTVQLSLPGKYAVLLATGQTARISTKIRDPLKKKELLAIGTDFAEASGCGCILRTNAMECSGEELMAALGQLAGRWEKVKRRGLHGMGKERIYAGMPGYLADLRDAASGDLTEIKTDDPELFSEMKDYLEESQPEDVGKLSFYEDAQISLAAVYGIRAALERALSERIWLKSGAYLVIQPTEALTVVDVNSGKAVKGKQNMEETVLKINREAAEELAAQLRIRGISGMILVDFINMKKKEHMEEVFDFLTACCRLDPVKTTVVDMTELGLVELTRKRINRPLAEYRRMLEL